jgi:hypothetical protein
MTYTADYLIQKRKEQWEQHHNINKDKELREAIAYELTNNEELLNEVKAKPEKLIELVFVVVDKEQKTMPFFVNDVQQEFLNTLNRAIEDFEKGLITDISILVLKGRQQGFTTLVTAYQLACSILNRNFQGFTLADKADNAEAIFQNKAKFPHSQLPNALKPSEKFNNRKQFLFEKINSSWAVDTATKDVGRSRTVNFFHGSECAFWKDGIAPIQSALGEAFTKNCIKIYESTANGFNDYQKMWNSNNHINCFFEWWKTKEYRISFEDEETKEKFLKDIDNKKNDWIWERLKWLRDGKELDNEQLYWYYKKYINYLEKDLIKQEYPCTPNEAFLMSGRCVFDVENIMQRLDNTPKPIKTGYFEYDYDGLKITNIRFVLDRNGFIKIYEPPNSPEVTSYCIGGDTAGEGSDYFTAHVINAKNGKQVAVLRHEFDADQYAKQMYCLGMYYSHRDRNNKLVNALIGIESNFDSFPIRELTRLGYTNQFVRNEEDTYTGKLQKRFGFRTDRNSRPRIISNLIEIVREHTNQLNDKETLEEMLTFVRNEKGRPEAQEGAHDDLVMGLAIAYEIQDQVVFNEDTITIEQEFQFSAEITEPDDWGSEVSII